MKILVVGSGGREHALVWSLARSPRVSEIFVAPGNAGTSRIAAAHVRISNIEISSDNISGLLAFALQHQIDLTVVGPEGPLASGIVDRFSSAGLLIFGPSQAAAQLESSKAFSKSFMRDFGIPTAEYARFHSYTEARDWLGTINHPVVVKADGLAAGKGVMVCNTTAEADEALQRILLKREFGAAGDVVVIEERLSGPEVSVLAFCDGHTVLTMPAARDHKRIFDHDAGPNTGGMGAYAPAPDVSNRLVAAITRDVLLPAVHGMASRGTPYVGVLYAGIMLTEKGAMTLEFNCRFGDPETQAVLPLLRSDLVDILLACCAGRLADIASQVVWREGACASVVLAAQGYPGSYLKGQPINGLDMLDKMQNMMVFHAGTTLLDDQVVSNGGRVLAVSAVGDDLPEAIARAYEGVGHIHFDGMHYRRDIGIRSE